MTMTAFRIALGASVLVLSAAAALSDDAPASHTMMAASSGTCVAAPAQASSLLINASITARHTNVNRVRYTAAHAMPAKRATPAAMTSCSPAKNTGSALD